MNIVCRRVLGSELHMITLTSFGYSSRWLVSPIGICRCDTKFMLISVMCALMSTVVGFAISLLLFSKKLLNIYNDYQDFKHLRDSVHETSVFASYFAVPSGVTWTPGKRAFCFYAETFFSIPTANCRSSLLELCSPFQVVGLVVCFVVAQRVYNRKVVQPLSRSLDLSEKFFLFEPMVVMCYLFYFS